MHDSDEYALMKQNRVLQLARISGKAPIKLRSASLFLAVTVPQKPLEILALKQRFCFVMGRILNWMNARYHWWIKCHYNKRCCQSCKVYSVLGATWVEVSECDWAPSEWWYSCLCIRTIWSNYFLFSQFSWFLYNIPCAVSKWIHFYKKRLHLSKIACSFKISHTNVAKLSPMIILHAIFLTSYKNKMKFEARFRKRFE